jgi:DNA invertase Pin-like site-specific DNA recombinase
MMATNAGNEFAGRMFEAINGMLLDMLAAVARKDYVDRRRRQAQGQAKAKVEGRYKGRPEDAERNDGISTSTTADVHIRALTAIHRIKPTSTSHRSARRPNPGRRSTYRRGIFVRTIGTSSVI